MVAVRTCRDHGIEVFGRGRVVELLNGLQVERCMRHEMSVDHGRVGGLQFHQVVTGQAVSAPTRGLGQP